MFYGGIRMVIICTMAFIILDFFTGYISGIAQQNLKSTIMRKGLFNKISLLIFITLGVLGEYAQNFYLKDIQVPTVLMVCGYISIMEITSIIENICKINDKIIPEKIKGMFGINDK